ncbi:MAG: serine/threonine protein kinase [Alphaproteobacteria bacterium]|nr:serine/threonine protein kinase [Alphaproteobacteria bacterium]
MAPSDAIDDVPTITDASDKVALGVKCEILPSYPQPLHDSTGGPAFAARLKGSSRADLLGYICNSGYPARSDIAQMLRAIDNRSFIKNIDGQVVQWPDGKRYYAFVTERPAAPRYYTDLQSVRQPLHEDIVGRQFVAPLTSALSDIEAAGTAHGAVRLTNIYWQEGGSTPPQLGECLSVPSGIGQPLLFESPERAVCPPPNRGPAQTCDDMYGLGVCAALMTLGQNPMRQLDDQTMLRMKLERGSFNSFMGNVRLTSSLTELLRGLLADDPRARWDIEDLEQWVNGRRLTPKPAEFGRKSTRSFTFADKEYSQAKTIARAMTQNIAAAVKVLETDALDSWLRRSLGDEARADDLAFALETVKAKGKTPRYEDLLVTHVSMALDPIAPIMYRGVNVMPGGIASALADAVRTNGNVQVLGEIIGNQLATFWVNLQKEAKTELVPLSQSIEKVKPHIEKNSYGSGVERAAYELNPALPCLSPMILSQYVLAPKELLPALESISRSSARPREPMDRHIAAWCIVRARKTDRTFAPLGMSDNPQQRGLALINLFADMQSRYGPERLPGLSQWIYPLAEPVVHRFHNRQLQETLREQLKLAAERGSFAMLAKLVDDPRMVQKDEQEFEAASLLHAAAAREIRTLERQIKNHKETADKYGRPAATYVACLIAVGMLIINIFRAFNS